MRARCRRLGWLAPLALVVLGTWPHGEAQNERPGRAEDDGFGPEDMVSGPSEKVLRVRVTGEIDASKAGGLRKAIRARLDEEPAFSFVLFEIDSNGGTPEGAEELAVFAFSELKSYRTIAWVPEGKSAFAAGAVLAFAANEIVMGPGARLGNLFDLARDWPRPEAKADRSPLQDLLLEFARERRYSTIIIKAMVSRDHDAVVKVIVRKGAGVETKFYYERDLDTRSVEEKINTQGDPLTILNPGEPLQKLDASLAKSYGLSQSTVPGVDREGVSSLLVDRRIHVGLDSVIDLESGALRPSFPAGQRVVEFFNYPLVRFILILGGCLGVLLEIKMLGSLVPGLIGLGCFLIFFVTSALPAPEVTGSYAGTASLFEITLFVIGLGLLALEFILLPGVAIFGLAGGALCAVSLVLAMVPGSTAYGSEQMGLQDAIVILICGCGASALTFIGLLQVLPKTSILAGGLVTRSAIEGVPTADSTLAAQAEAMKLVGRTGTVETGLRPAGKIVLDDGTLLDVVSQGELIEKGDRVVIKECTATRIVVVRQGSPKQTEED